MKYGDYILFWIMHPTMYLPSWVRYPKEKKFAYIYLVWNSPAGLSFILEVLV